jgi:hypothetical protein
MQAAFVVDEADATAVLLEADAVAVDPPAALLLALEVELELEPQAASTAAAATAVTAVTAGQSLRRENVNTLSPPLDPDVRLSAGRDGIDAFGLGP